VKRYKTNIDDNWSIIHATYGVLSVRCCTRAEDSSRHTDSVLIPILTG